MMMLEVTSILTEKFILNSNCTIRRIERIKITVENVYWNLLMMTDQLYLVRIVLIMQNKCLQADINAPKQSYVLEQI